LGAEDGSTEGTLYWTRKNIASELANLNNDINTKTLEKIA
jgi:hypothetical protein